MAFIKRLLTFHKGMMYENAEQKPFK